MFKLTGKDCSIIAVEYNKLPKCHLRKCSVYWFPNKKSLYLLLCYWLCSVLDISGPGDRGYCYNSGEPPSGQREGTVWSSHCYLPGKISISNLNNVYINIKKILTRYVALTSHPGISNSFLPKCAICLLQWAVGVSDLRNQFRSYIFCQIE